MYIWKIYVGETKDLQQTVGQYNIFAHINARCIKRLNSHKYISKEIIIAYIEYTCKLCVFNKQIHFSLFKTNTKYRYIDIKLHLTIFTYNATFTVSEFLKQ